MDRIAGFATFARAYEVGNFSAVAREFGVSQPTVSKQIAALEAHLGLQLFSRTTRRLHPTADALRLYPQVRQLLDMLEIVEASSQRRADSPSGMLRIVIPESFGRADIVPRVARFLRAHPNVQIDLRMTDETTDLVGEGAELGIRIGKLTSGTLVARRLTSVRQYLVASRDYLAERGEPRSLDELAAHDCIVYTGFPDPNRWVFDSEYGQQVVEIAPVVSFNSADGIATAVAAGIGIAVLPSWLLADELRDGRVRVLLPDYYPPVLPVQIVYPETRWLSLRARAFIDFLVAEYAIAPRPATR